MKYFCFACGVIKNLNEHETFVHFPDSDEEEKVLTPPLTVIECQSQITPEWKVVVVCHKCHYKLDPDMWISRNCWNKLNPIIPFEELPNNNISVEDGKWDVENYFK